MRRPRIITDRSPAFLDRLTANRPVRYGIGISITVIITLLAWLIGPISDNYSYLLLFFMAIALTSVFAGMGPGFTATALSFIALHWLLRNYLNREAMVLLMVQGVLVSIVGGTLRAAREKARERLEANMRLEQQILEIGDDERRRIGHDLHDGLGQHLTGISLLSESMAQQIQSGQVPNSQNVETITELVSQAVKITRDLAKSLSPVTLEQDGLIAAIQELTDTSSSLFGINCQPEFDYQDLRLDRTRSLHLFRIVQEAVNNSVRHGKAHNVRIHLVRSGSLLTVKVADDGSGLSQKTMTNPGLGLRIMQYRARMLHASLNVERANSAGGTVVTCVCPLDGSASGSESNHGN